MLSDLTEESESANGFVNKEAYYWQQLAVVGDRSCRLWLSHEG